MRTISWISLFVAVLLIGASVVSAVAGDRLAGMVDVERAEMARQKLAAHPTMLSHQEAITWIDASLRGDLQMGEALVAFRGGTFWTSVLGVIGGLLLAMIAAAYLRLRSRFPSPASNSRRQLAEV